MAQFKTPDVYIKEHSTLLPTVMEVATAIPAFLGFTEQAINEEREDLTLVPTRVAGMAEYKALFGSPYEESFSIHHNADTDDYLIAGGEVGTSIFFLYQAVEHFFVNGGRVCYIVSLGDYTTINTQKKSRFAEGINLLETIDDVTLIALPESIHLPEQDHYDLHNQSLAHSSKLQDRFSLIDVRQTAGSSHSEIKDDAAALRESIIGDLKYGAAYYPYLRTTWPRAYNDDKVRVNFVAEHLQLHPEYDGAFYDAAGVIKLDACGYPLGDRGKPIEGARAQPVYVQLSHHHLRVDLRGYAVTDTGERNTTIDRPFGIFNGGTDADGNPRYVTVEGRQVQGKDSNDLDTNDTFHYAIPRRSQPCHYRLSELNNAGLRFASSAIYSRVSRLLASHYLVLPPSAAIAGVIAQTDADRGVWKAPANVPLTQVLAPVVNIDNGQQESLNRDTTGKSINAVRSFVGQGTLVWGARTLAGNDNEWRYVSVRRLFNHVEASLKKSTHFAVFEPNTPFTWLKLRTLIDNYLEGLWRQGAFVGNTPAEAYFVNAGLGQTMTEDDINNGVMRIEVGLAVVRPAEFIVLTFSQKSLEV